MRSRRWTGSVPRRPGLRVDTHCAPGTVVPPPGERVQAGAQEHVLVKGPAGELVARGAGPTRSAFLSAFFTLVGCHGLHVSAGILWLLTMMAQVFAKGFRPDIQRRILCFNLFWHALDIIWGGVFTVVYLLGAAL